MKVRIKFTKEGPIKFVGHLDTMRYFQKAVRRAGLPAAFSGGYSPHMIMSFAAPLGVGIESLGEYFDIELKEELPTDEIRDRLEAQMAEGVHVLSARKVEDGKASNAMSLVAAADYFVAFREGEAPREPWQERIAAFLAQPEILVMKESKKGTREVDIRPGIYQMQPKGEGVFLQLAAASGNYTRPEMVMSAFCDWLGHETGEFPYAVKRLEVYADVGEEETHRFVPLEGLGEEVE